MKLPIVTFLFLIYSYSFGQVKNYQNLIYTALTSHNSLFVHSKPLQGTGLVKKQMSDYAEAFKEWSNQTLDTIMLAQIIENDKITDSTHWKEEELPVSLIVHERGETVSKKYAIQKFGLTERKKIRYYKKKISKFNSKEPNDRVIYYFSKPVFDNSKTFAIIQWDNGHQ